MAVYISKMPATMSGPNMYNTLLTPQKSMSILRLRVFGSLSSDSGEHSDMNVFFRNSTSY